MNQSARKSAILMMTAAALGVGLVACASTPAKTATEVPTQDGHRADGSCSAAGCGAKKDDTDVTETSTDSKDAKDVKHAKDGDVTAAMTGSPASTTSPASAPATSGSAAKVAAKAPAKPTAKKTTAGGDAACGAGSCAAKKKK